MTSVDEMKILFSQYDADTIHDQDQNSAVAVKPHRLFSDPRFIDNPLSTHDSMNTVSDPSAVTIEVDSIQSVDAETTPNHLSPAIKTSLSKHTVIPTESRHTAIAAESQHSAITAESQYFAIADESQHSAIAVDTQSQYSAVESLSSTDVTKTRSLHSAISMNIESLNDYDNQTNEAVEAVDRPVDFELVK